MKNNTILVVAAHPDDEVLGCGGAMAKHLDEGDQVFVLYMSSGVGARDGVEGAEADERLINSQESLKRLGKIESIRLNLIDNQFDSMPLLNVIKQVERVINKVNPNIIYTHFIGDLNIDHRLTCQAVCTACRPIPDSSIKKILMFEIPSSTEWGIEKPFAPNYFINIEKYWEKKIYSIKAYGGEIKDFPHPRSLKNIEALAKLRGATIGLKYAEAYSILRIIN